MESTKYSIQLSEGFENIPPNSFYKGTLLTSQSKEHIWVDNIIDAAKYKSIKEMARTIVILETQGFKFNIKKIETRVDIFEEPFVEIEDPTLEIGYALRLEKSYWMGKKGQYYNGSGTGSTKQLHKWASIEDLELIKTKSEALKHKNILEKQNYVLQLLQVAREINITDNQLSQ